MEQEIINTIALTQIKGIGNAALQLYKTAGSATAIVANRHHLRDIAPDCSDKLTSIIDSGLDAALAKAESEAEYIDRHAMTALPFNDSAYPERLRLCEDAPVLLYYSGNADLNANRIISIVGTRHCTNYGKDLCRDFISSLQSQIPDCIIVSGLAYGIDVCAHRNALDNGMKTVGVLAHGLEKIYPYYHRPIAVEMARQGGLLTEYITGSVIEKGNFVRRNRIVAGISDATIVVESADKGGSLITANIASSYGRELFAFPGRVYDEYSAGCNRIIRTNMAMAITNTEDFLKAMNWMDKKAAGKPNPQGELFITANEEEQKVIDYLRTHGESTNSDIAMSTGMKFHSLSSILFELEMKGIVAIAGGLRYRLINSNM